MPTITDISFVDEAILKDHFLTELARFGYVVIAEDETGLKGYHKRWVKDDPDYARRAEEAKDAFKGVIFREIIRRGVIGNKKKKFHKDEPIIDPETGEQYVEYEQSDRLLLALAAAHDDSFRTTKQEIEHSGGIGVEHAGSLNIGGTVKHAIYTDPDYIDYLETKRLEGRGDSIAVGSDGDGRKVLDTTTLESIEPSDIGDDTRGRGDSAADGDDAAEAW